ADARVGDAALMSIGHPLDVHDLLMVGAVVVHHAQEWNPVMRGGPQRSRGVHEVTVILNADAQPAMLPMSERRAHRNRQPASDGRGAAASERLIMLVDRPQTRAGASNHRPVFVLDGLPQ